MSSTQQDAAFAEKANAGSGLPTAEASGELQSNGMEVPTKVEPSDEEESSHEKMRFAELREGISGWKWVLFHIIIFFGSAISGYDVSNVSTIQISIYRAFGRIDLLPWVVATYSLGNAAMSPIMDHIMKLIDLKLFSICCWTLFLVATAVTGASPTIEGVIVGRTLLGVAGGGCYLSLLTYTTILARPTEHARLSGLLGMGFAVGLVLGPVIGGAFAENEHATWRWAFYIGVPYVAIIIGLILIVYPRTRLHPEQDIIKGLRKIDWVGGCLHIITLVLFDAACIFSGSTLPWNSGAIALWVLSGLVAIFYAAQQYFSLFTDPSNRILPIGVLSTRTGLLVALCTLFTCCGYSISLYYLPLYYSFTRGNDSLEIAVHMLPFICVYIAAVIGCGILLPVIRRYALIYLIGGLLITSGSASMMSLDANSSLSHSMGLGSLIGFGVGSTVQLGASVTALALPANIRMDSSITMTMFIYGGTTIALALAGCIFQNIGFQFLSDALEGYNFSNDQIHEALAGFESPVWVATDQAAVASAIGAVTEAIIRTFYISLVAGAFMFVCALTMKWEAIDFKSAKKKEMEEGVQASPAMKRSA